MELLDNDRIRILGVIQTSNFSCAEPTVNDLSLNSFALGSAHEKFDV